MNELDQPTQRNEHQDLIILTDLLTDYLLHLAIGQAICGEYAGLPKSSLPHLSRFHKGIDWRNK
ncbi:hypothetical protein C7B61_04730 [filamentous cyanobacterium CCP1]|nr:hypothetical protein C7B76_26065 [filamentous cyanobacterium CCP2]PSB67710.1 hypothetical protein C7B61_04730 [filamentous cyanobacterium CCP1]